MLPSMLKKKLKLSNVTASIPGKVSLKRKIKSEPSKKNPKRKVDHFKALTTDEINSLRETEDVTNESLFALQITEIIKASKPNEKYEHFIRTWTTEFFDFISALSSETEKRPLADWVANGLIAPLDETKLNIPDFEFQFILPKQTLAIGSRRMETNIGPNITIDLVVEIPGKCFQKTDYLNMIYHKKKALYLAYLAQKLSAWSKAAECKFQFFANDKFNPVLMIHPNSSKKVTFFVHVCCESNTFKLNRFLPSTSNTRSSLFGENETEILPTPHYSSSVLADMTLLQNEEFLNQSLNGVPNIKNAIVLFKLWLRTRGLDRSGFNGFVASMFAVWLLKKNKINVSMTVYEILKNLWMNLATSKWNESGISLCPTQTDFGLFHEYFDVVFLELNGANNICANLYLDVYLRVRDESAKAIQFLSKATINNFRYLFTNKLPVNLQFDHIIKIKENVNLQEVILTKAPQNVIHDFCGDWYPVAVKVISKTLRRGFGKRIASMMPLTPSMPSWNIDKKCPKFEPCLSFGLILNAESASDVVDKGPQHDDEGAEQFKIFWGDKSELRRFNDGTIVEACLWNSPSDALAKKRVICKAITLHLLNYHYGIRPSDIVYVADEFDVAYQLESTHFLFEDKEDNSENLAFAVIKSFDEVAKHLRALDKIPLDISSVLGISPVFRYCEVEPIMAQSNEVIDGNTQIFQSYAVNEGVIQFAANGKWPNNLAVIEQIKAAFYVRIAQGMQEQFKLPARGNTQCVEIIKNGFLYRLRIALPKELQLRRQYTTPKGVVSHRDTAESLHIEKNLFLLPTLTVSLHTIYHQHTSFGPAVLIAKRWLYSQLLNPFLWPDECTELLMAYVYMQTNSFATPTQPQAAFFRLLHLLATTNWDQDMILLNFNDILSDESVRSLETRFATDRDSFPPMCIVTSWDNKAFSIWSKKAPISAVISRVAVLATHALSLVQLEIGSDAGIDPRALFVPSLDGYDVVITLRKSHVQTCNLYDFASSTKRSKMVDRTVPAADFNLAQYFLRDLRAAYDEFAVFFYDPRGGEVITVLWKPSANVSQDFEVATIFGRKMDADNKYAVNYKQIIEDFRIIGKGLVETINVQEIN